MLDEIYLRLLVELLPANLKLNSWETSRLLEQSRLEEDAGRIYAELIQQLYHLDPDSNIGLRFGQHLHPGTLCDFSRALMTSPDFRTVVELISRYHYVHSASYFPSIHIDDATLSIALSYPFKPEVSVSQRRFCAEGVFSYIVNALRETIATDIQPVRLCFDFEQPRYAQEYARHFACELDFAHPLAMLVLDKKLLNRGLSTSNPTLHSLYLSKCIDQWRRGPKHRDVCYRAMIALMQKHPESFSSPALAQELNISVRGLQKRLNKYDQSFSHLSARARRELAKIYLFQQGASIDATAEQLGFQTSSGFRRFFKSEFGQTPAEFLGRRNCAKSA